MTHPSEEQVERVAAGLTGKQRDELLAVRAEDCGYLARGDQARLVHAGLAVPPMGSGYYYLSNLGLAVRQFLQSKDKHSDQ
jgi:hypothetical protein